MIAIYVAQNTDKKANGYVADSKRQINQHYTCISDLFRAKVMYPIHGTRAKVPICPVTSSGGFTKVKKKG